MPDAQFTTWTTSGPLKPRVLLEEEVADDAEDNTIRRCEQASAESSLCCFRDVYCVVVDVFHRGAVVTWAPCSVDGLLLSASNVAFARIRNSAWSSARLACAIPLAELTSPSNTTCTCTCCAADDDKIWLLPRFRRNGNDDNGWSSKSATTTTTRRMHHRHTPNTNNDGIVRPASHSAPLCDYGIIVGAVVVSAVRAGRFC